VENKLTWRMPVSEEIRCFRTAEAENILNGYYRLENLLPSSPFILSILERLLRRKGDT
jgi:hypothetical protein